MMREFAQHALRQVDTHVVVAGGDERQGETAGTGAHIKKAWRACRRGADDRRAHRRGNARRECSVTIEGRRNTVKGAGGQVDTGQRAPRATARNRSRSLSALRMAILPYWKIIIAKQPSIVDTDISILARAAAKRLSSR